MYSTITLFTITILFNSCMSLYVQHLNNANFTYNQVNLKNLEGLREIDNKTIQFVFPDLDNSYNYKNCFSISRNGFDFCEKNSQNILEFSKPLSTENFKIYDQKGFIYFEQEIAFVNENMVQNYFDFKRQFGFPKSISISEDGNSRLITYPRPRKDLDDVCYHEELNKKNPKFEFKQVCEKLNKRIKFYPMKKIKIPKAIYILFQDKDSEQMKYWVSQNEKYNLFINIDTLSGEKIQKPNVLLKLLYPPAFLLDFITFPIQILLFNFKTPLG